jgi:U3 small nucleolar RNA-associated protein 25
MSLKLYEQFYASDIIVASPLALRLLCGHKVDSKANDMTEKIDQDFLSSIEFLVMDQSEAFIYQNLEHLEEVLKALNQRPKKLTQLNDISRLFEIYTEKPAKHHSMFTPLFR